MITEPQDKVEKVTFADYDQYEQEPIPHPTPAGIFSTIEDFNNGHPEEVDFPVKWFPPVMVDSFDKDGVA